ncbi:LysR family transcriptional regulator [Sneathiella aquimaris]|uniref:LysR family transcriptional regulator n=1 Tax=Sneathiella aquimaris TaxID=2599305 RepID=UPI00146F5A0A|nr:LysR family transcriptional regulator [Sneathiella aquimaris]
MNIRQLTYYIAIFEQKNLSRAASHCNVAQSAISHHLANLEENLGVTLFTRKPRGMEPTAAGIKLYDHAKMILKAVKSAEQDIRGQSDAIAGEIAIGLPFTVMKAVGLPFMKAVLRDYPDVRLSIVESLSGGTFANLLSSEVDIALFYNPQKDDRVTSRQILAEEVLCVGKHSIIGASDTVLTFDDLVKFPILLLRQGVSVRAVVDRPSILNRLEAQVPIHLNSVNGITTGLLAGLGCTLAPHVFVSDYLKSGELHARPIEGPLVNRRLFIGQLKDRPATRLVEAMTDLLLSLIAEEVNSGRWQAESNLG